MKISKVLKDFYQKNFSSFRRKLTLGFIVAGVIPVLIVGGLAYSFSYSISKKNIIDALNYSNTQLNDTISNRFTQMKNVSDSIQYYLYLLDFDKSKSITRNLDNSSNFRTYISGLKETFDFYNITVYLRPEHFLSNEGITFLSLYKLSNRGISEKDIKVNINEWNLFEDQTTPFMSMHSGKIVNYISCYRSMIKQSTGKLEYVYFIDIDEREIASFLNATYKEGEISNYIVNRNGYIMSHPKKELIGKQIDEKLLSYITKGGSNSLASFGHQIIVKYNKPTGWYVVTEVSNSYILKNTSVLSNLVLVSIILIVLLIIYVIYFISRNLSSKINSISSIIAELTTTKDVNKINALIALSNKDSEYRDEIDHLAGAFVEMFVKLDKSFDQILEMKLQEEKLKYQLLQAKINPHLLYNILESIKTCYSIGMKKEANILIDKLAKFYRLSLRKSDELITIKDELEITQIYLDIESICRDNSFECRFNLEEEIENFLIPKFTLQPLLENCILHGMKSPDEKLIINVDIKYKEEAIIIIISDNGLGISSDTLERIKNTLKEKRWMLIVFMV